MIVLAGQSSIFNQSFSANPATPLHWELDLPEGPIRVKVVDSNNQQLLDFVKVVEEKRPVAQ